MLQDLSPEVAAPLGLQPYGGVLVSGILPGTEADHRGLRSGDVVTEVNGRKVKDRAAVKGVLERAAGTRVLLRVQRGDTHLFIGLEP